MLDYTSGAPTTHIHVSYYHWSNVSILSCTHDPAPGEVKKTTLDPVYEYFFIETAKSANLSAHRSCLDVLILQFGVTVAWGTDDKASQTVSSE